MDFNGVFGILICVASLIFLGMGYSNVLMFFDIPSVGIVFIGTFMVLIGGYPMSFWKTVPSFFKMYLIVQKRDIAKTINQIITFAEQARREGILALENSLEKVDDPFLKKGIQLAVDGTEKAIIESILETEKDNIEERHKANFVFVESIAAMGPAFGMLGTTIGLVLMLQNMSDPSAIGPAMAVALITTFYGSLLANLISWPVATRLKVRHSEEMMEKQVMLEGILSVQAGENPRVVQWKLSAYLTPEARMKLEAEKERERQEARK
jgi:chemotaxis protein MotA